MSKTGVGLRIGFGDFGAHAIEDFDFLELADLELRVRHANHGHVTNTQVLNRPVHNGVEVFTAAEPAEDRPGPDCFLQPKPPSR